MAYLFLLIFTIQAHSTLCSGICNKPLGVQNGYIKDYQMSSAMVCNNEMSKYGPQHARLMETSHGYRGIKGKLEQSWVSIDLGRKMVVTGIATQGYGNTSVTEWVTEFQLMYSVKNSGFNTFRDASGERAIFVGNKDSNSVHRQAVPFPVIASRVTIWPLKANNNVGLRLEVYGCEPDFNFTVLLMLSGRHFTMNYRNNKSYEYLVAVEESLSEVRSYWSDVPGFLGIVFKGFTPQAKTSPGFTFTGVEFEVYCLEPYLQTLLTKMKKLIKESKIFDSDFYKLRFPRTDVCSPPSLNIEPLAKDKSKLTAILKSSSPVFKVEIQHNCTLEGRLIHYWKFASIDAETLQMSPFRPQSTINRRRVRLRPKAYDSSYIYLYCEVYMLGVEGNFAQDYRFIRIIDAKLFAVVKGFRHAIKGGNNITVDGSESNAQGDSAFLSDIDMKFGWFCQRTNVNSTDDSSALVRSCFGRTKSQPISRDKTLHIDINDLIGGMRYTFRLVVNANGVSSSAKHVITVEKYTRLSIRCFSNCFRKVNPASKQVLRLECNGGACDRLTSYDWSFYLFINQTKTWKIMESPGNITTKSEGGIMLSINNFTKLIEFNNLKDELFKIRVVAHLDAHAYVYAEKNFILNAVPNTDNQSGCFINPREGYAMNTYFNMSCENWEDEDLPLTYSFQYESEFGMIILQSGYTPFVRTQLLPGNNGSNFTFDIIITIIDSLGALEKRLFPVKVLLPSASEAKSTMKNISGELECSLRSGNPDKAADMSLYVLSLLKTFVEDPEEVIKTKDNILHQLTNKVDITSLPQVSKFSAVARSASNQTKKLNLKTQSSTLYLMEKSSNTMKSFVVNKSSDVNLGMMESVAETFVYAISNVLNSSLDEHKTGYQKTDDPVKDDRHQRINTSKRSSALVEDVTTSITSLMAVGDSPSVVRSNNVRIRVEKNTPKSFDRKTITQGLSNIILPSFRDVLSNTKVTPRVMDCRIVEYPVNPFFWHNSSKIIQSAVVEISLHTDTGRAMKVTSLENPINLYLPRKEQELNRFRKRNLSSIDMNFFLKSALDGNSTENAKMRYHTVNIPSPYLTVTLYLVPQKGEEFEVFIEANKKPTVLHYNYTTKLPDLSSCDNKDVKTFNPGSCHRNPYEIEITSNITGSTGLQYIGVRHVQQITPNSIRVPRSNRKRLCPSYNGRQKRACVGVKDPPTIPPRFATINPTYNHLTDIRYHLSSSLSACMFWSEEEERWKSDGCKLGPNSTSTHVHCLCHHLTAFGGNFFVAPNPIDFDKVLLEFSRLRESHNYVVLSTICLMWLMFMAGLVWARKADQYDKLKINSFHLNPSNLTKPDSIKYKISIQTGVWRSSGTTASVGMMLYGIETQSEPLYISNVYRGQTLFTRGSINEFFVAIPTSLGDVFKLKLWHDNRGSNPSWFVKDVVVSEDDSKDQWYFLVDRWLALNEGDSSISADVCITEERVVKKFKNRFYSRATKQFTNSHLWLSLFAKSVHSPFTRCQRLSCCFLILMSTMVTNAMFYQFGTKPDNFFLIGPFKVSLRGIITGIQSALIVIPINVLVVFIFDHVKHEQNEEDSPTVVSKGFIPRMFILVAWFLCVSGAVVSSAFTIMYSLVWGPDIANQWFLSIIVSFMEDVVCIQPIKIILAVSFLAMIIKRPIDNHEGVSISGKHNFVSNYKVESPSAEELAKTRDEEAKKLALKSILFEIGSFLLFLVLLFLVCYVTRDNQRFMVTQALEAITEHFNEIKDKETYWRWLKEEAVENIFEDRWYNGHSFSQPEGLVKNRKVFLIGMPRLRQLRVKQEKTCLRKTVPLAGAFFKRCLPNYSMFSEDNTPYNLPGWKQSNNLTSYISKYQLEKLCPKPWRYRSFQSIQTLPFLGTDVVYGGGGFVADLGYNKETATNVIKNLQNNNWTDEYTAAIFLEFTVFNPGSSLFSSVKYLYERFPSGSMNTITRIDTINVYSPTNKSLYTFVQLCRLLLMMMIVVFLAIECIKIYQIGRSYFKEIWNWVQWLQIISTVSAIVMFYFKEKYTSKFMARLHENPFESSSTDYIVMWSDLETFVLSFVIFIVTIKLLRLIRLNPFISHLTNTLKLSARHLLSYCVFFLIAMTALCFLAFFAFGKYSYEFSSFTRTLVKLMQLMVGGKIYRKDVNFAKSRLAPFFVLCYTVLTTVILVNMLLSILIESYMTSRTQADTGYMNDYHIAMFAKDYLSSLLSSGNTKVNAIMRKTFYSSHNGKVYHCAKDTVENGRSVDISAPRKAEYCNSKLRSPEREISRNDNSSFYQRLKFAFSETSEKETSDEIGIREIRGSLAEISDILRYSIGGDQKLPRANRCLSC